MTGLDGGADLLVRHGGEHAAGAVDHEAVQGGVDAPTAGVGCDDDRGEAVAFGLTRNSSRPLVVVVFFFCAASTNVDGETVPMARHAVGIASTPVSLNSARAGRPPARRRFRAGPARRSGQCVAQHVEFQSTEHRVQAPLRAPGQDHCLARRSSGAADNPTCGSSAAGCLRQRWEVSKLKAAPQTPRAAVLAGLIGANEGEVLSTADALGTALLTWYRAAHLVSGAGAAAPREQARPHTKEEDRDLVTAGEGRARAVAGCRRAGLRTRRGLPVSSSRRTSAATG